MPGDSDAGGRGSRDCKPETPYPFRAHAPAFSGSAAQGFDVVVRKPGAFRHRGKSEHDQYYLMTYRPKAGRAAAGDRGGKPVIVRPGDRIGMTGSTDAIYYCRLGGGIYDEPMLSSLLAVDDSLGRVQGALSGKCTGSVGAD